MLNHKTLEQYALAKNGVTKEYPFDDKTAVFKVAQKMFLLFNDQEKILRFNVKCDQLYALELRLIYESVTAGYHMNKKHWNSVMVDGSIDNATLLSFVDDSYELVFSKLTKKLQTELLQS